MAPLIALYNATDGPYWKNNENWLSDKPLNEWYGITTDTEGRVSEIDLELNWLLGQIPAELAQLQNLQRLNLRLGNLSGTIPPEIGLLTNLTHLNLGGNKLIGRIPKELGLLPNIIDLNLNGNRLIGEIPPSLTSSQSLTHLDISSNQISGSIPREFVAHSRLEVFDLSDNELTGKIPREIEQLRNLVELRLRNNRLSGEISTGIGKLLRLEMIELQHNRFTGEIPSEISNLPELHTLYLDDNKLTGAIPQSLASQRSLGWLGIVDNNFTGCIPRTLREVTSSNVEYANIPICGGPPRPSLAMPDFIEMAFGDSATPSQKFASRLGARWLADFIEKIGWPKPENLITVYVDDLDGLARAWADRLGGCDLQCAREDLRWIGGTALRGATFNGLFGLSPFALDGQVDVVAHEIVHAIQYDLLDRQQLPEQHRDPEWWIEGTATLIQYLAVAEGRGQPFNEARQSIANTAESNYVPLSTLDEERGACAHHCGAAAIDLLAQQVGLRKLADFYTERQTGGTWQQTFEQVFNISVPDFYELFNQHHRNGYPLRPLPTEGSTQWP